jgi:hypothetical protein
MYRAASSLFAIFASGEVRVVPIMARFPGLYPVKFTL